jgi:hypothetical protein
MNKTTEILEDFIKSLSTSCDDRDDDSILDIDKVPAAASEIDKTVVEIEVEPDDVHLREKEENEEVEKAMTVGSIPTLGSATRRSIYASATTPVTRQFTKLTPPEGRAPLLPVPSMKYAHDEYSSCNAHGLTYKSTSECPHCAMSKSYSCKSCGGDLVKQIGGTTSCQKCGA